MVPSLSDAFRSFFHVCFLMSFFFSCAFLYYNIDGLLSSFINSNYWHSGDLWRCVEGLLKLDLIWRDLLQTKLVIYSWCWPASTLVTVLLTTLSVRILSFTFAVRFAPGGDRGRRSQVEHGWSTTGKTTVCRVCSPRCFGKVTTQIECFILPILSCPAPHFSIQLVLLYIFMIGNNSLLSRLLSELH